MIKLRHRLDKKIYGSRHEGSHEAYFSKDVFDRRLARLSSNRCGEMGGRRAHLLSKFAHCSECGRLYTAEEQTGAHNSGRYVYYKHRCGGRRRELRFREDDILKSAAAAVAEFRMKPDFAGRLSELFREPLRERRRQNRKEIDFISEQIKEWTARQAKLLDLFTADGIDRDELLARRKEYGRRIQGLNARLSSLTQNNEKVFDRIVHAVDLIRELPERFLQAPTEEKKIEALKTMARTLLLDPSGAMTIEWHQPFNLLLRSEMKQAIQEGDAAALKEKVGPGDAGAPLSDGFNSVEANTHNGTDIEPRLTVLESIISDFKYWMAAGAAE